jgi:hypothetical protein
MRLMDCQRIHKIPAILSNGSWKMDIRTWLEGQRLHQKYMLRDQHTRDIPIMD